MIKSDQKQPHVYWLIFIYKCRQWIFRPAIYAVEVFRYVKISNVLGITGCSVPVKVTTITMFAEAVEVFHT